MSARFRILCVSLPLLLPACTAERPGTSGSGITRDSAGIRIVESPAPVWTAADAWRVADQPTLQMGVAEGDPDHEFYQVRGLIRLSDGTIVVANGGTSELRYYGPDGALRFRAGGKGGGPGEFTLLAGLERLVGDSVLAIDAGQRRASIFGPNGRHIRDFPTGDASTVIPRTLVGQLDDGTYIAQATNMSFGPQLLQRQVGSSRDSLLVLRVDASGAPLDTLGVFPGPRMNTRMVDFMGRKLPMPTPVAFSSSMQLAAAGDRVYIGESDVYEIGVYSPEGRLTHLIRRPHEPRLVTKEDAEAIQARMREAFENQSNPLAKQMSEIYADMEVADTMPAYGRFLVDGDRNLWVTDYSGPKDSTAHWNVFDTNGRWLGAIDLPSKLLINEIGSDYVLARTVDDAEVERVVLYTLIKPRATAS
jgi:hypothetical protein